ncbi:MAG: hypothetical protein PHQ40_03610, partial [Anaerolineaceae bacterium]|nr:hypothetical protein [Anaerolineaceae bacterium]
MTSLNRGDLTPDTYHVDPAHFSSITGSPFAYWVGDVLRQLFRKLPSISSSGVTVQHGASSKNDFRFLRIWWEVLATKVGKGRRWYPFAKGGQYSPFYSDVHLLINWENDAEEIRQYILNQYPYLAGNTGWIIHPENSYLSPGLTWPRRTSGFSVRILPKGCIFADKGPTAFVDGDDPNQLQSLLAVMNSRAFFRLVQIQLARTELAQSFEVGIIQNTPVPIRTCEESSRLSELAFEAYRLMRQVSCFNETTHIFQLPSILLLNLPTAIPASATTPAVPTTAATAIPAPIAQATRTITATAAEVATREMNRQRSLAEIQHQIDILVANLYGVPELAEEDEQNNQHHEQDSEDQDHQVEEAEDEDVDETALVDSTAMVRALLSWCVGIAFGRWDVRLALDPSRQPPLPDPFDPLPVCSPGMLQGPDGLPLAPQALPADYPLKIAADGVLVDDPGHLRD